MSQIVIGFVLGIITYTLIVLFFREPEHKHRWEYSDRQTLDVYNGDSSTPFSHSVWYSTRVCSTCGQVENNLRGNENYSDDWYVLRYGTINKGEEG